MKNLPDNTQNKDKFRTLSQHVQNTEEIKRQLAHSQTILGTTGAHLSLTPTDIQPTSFLKVLPEELPAMSPEVMLDVEEASVDDTSGDTVQEPEEREKDLQKT